MWIRAYSIRSIASKLSISLMHRLITTWESQSQKIMLQLLFIQAKNASRPYLHSSTVAYSLRIVIDNLPNCLAAAKAFIKLSDIDLSLVLTKIQNRQTTLEGKKQLKSKLSSLPRWQHHQSCSYSYLQQDYLAVILLNFRSSDSNKRDTNSIGILRYFYTLIRHNPPKEGVTLLPA